MKTVVMHNAQQGHQVLLRMWEFCKPHLIAGRKLVLTAQEEVRNGSQNALLHALLTEVAEHVEWAGRRRDVETWKRLLVAAWLRARGDSVEFLPALDGHGVDIVFRRTSRLTKAECAELIDFVQAWAADRGVHINEPEIAS